MLKKDRISQVTLLLFLFLSVWWIYIFFLGVKDDPINHTFGFVYGGFSLWGALWGFIVAKKWGGFKSLMGRAILSLMAGLFLQAFGQYSFWYFNYVLHVEVPYPGVPDIGYFGTIPFYIYAALLLAKASGVKVSFKSFLSKIQAVLIPVGMVTLAYSLFLQNYDFASSTPLQIFLDFGYPMGQAIYISIAILTYSLSRKVLGGIMKERILFILAAFLAQFLAEYIFVYYHDLYFPASFIDYFYLLAYTIMTLGILQLRTVMDRLK